MRGSVIKIVALVIALFIIHQVKAQVFRTGLIGGIAGSQIEGDGYGGYKKLGVIIGGYTGIDITERWETQFEVYYINKGSQKNPRPDKGDFDYLRVELDYIEVPVALRFKHHHFRFEAGLYYGVLLRDKVEDQFGIRNIQNFPFKKGDFGGFIGIAYYLNDHLSFNLRSKSSLLPIRDFQNKDANIGIFNKLFNRGWYNLDLNFTLRYHFGK